MIATAHIQFDRRYYELHYDEWLRHRSRLKRYEIWFASVLLLWGVILSVVFPSQWLVGAIVACVGALQVAMCATHKRRWVNARTSTVRDDKSVDLTFDDESLTSTSKIGTSSLRLAGFTEFTPGSHGFFLIPDTGVSIYIPRATIDPSDSYSVLLDLLASQIGSEKSRR